MGGPSEARLALLSTPDGRDESLRVITYSTGQAKEVASADSAEEMKDTTDEQPWRLHFMDLNTGSNTFQTFSATIL